MKSNEVHVFATPMFRHLEKVAYSFKAAGACEIRSDIVERHRYDRINFDLAFLHSVPLTCRYAGPMPYANAARDLTRSNTVAQILYEQHATSLGRDIGNWRTAGRQLPTSVQRTCSSAARALQRAARANHEASNPTRQSRCQIARPQRRTSQPRLQVEDLAPCHNDHDDC